VLGVRPPRNPDIRSIVCAVDFSACSQLALQCTAELARLEKLPAIKVLNVYEIPLGFMEAGLTSRTAALKIEAVHRSQMEEFLRAAQRAVECEPVFREGSPAPTIAAYADEIGADLIVVGSHGRSSLAAFLLGSTSSRILHHARVPVWAVKSPRERETLWQALDKL
jgi:nucleotide-binding universal stress UspA family protein